MINLLPPEEKEKILLEKKKRMVIILWILGLFFLVCLILILFSVKIYLQIQVETQKTLLSEAEMKFGQSEARELHEKINSINSTLTRLDSFYQEKIYLVEILEKISKILPKKTYLTKLSAIFSKNEEEFGFTISLSGFAPTREALFEFKKNLEEENCFKEVYFPPANWVQATDIDFLVTFKIGDRY